jgi:hypothetical protein
MEENAWPAGSQHDRHFARRRFHGVQLDDRLPYSFAREVLRSLFREEKLKTHAPTAP